MFSFWKRKSGVPEAPLLGVEGAILSDVGCHRQLNEDSGTVVLPEDAAVLARRGVLAVVADGMGGHEAGEVASRMAVEALRSVYYAGEENPGEALAAGFERANREILELARRRPECAGMGTTCTALALVAGGAWLAHVGDSRMYMVRRGAIYQMSEDHSEVMEMVRRGVLSLDQARRHEDRNVLLRALGTREEVEVSRWSEPMPVFAGDRFLLCSDGLHDLIPEEQLRNTVLSAAPGEACRRLVDAARARGGYDNITVAVLAVASTQAAPARPRETRASEVTQ